ncbi:MAG: carbohydrate binding domain-containing protein, partial [Victivallales bacterium]|nr:carbohydrate binding domain-containing protein [Victivallales bacterium]
MKRTIPFALALSAIAAFAQNLLVNPSFEELTADGMPQGWSVIRNNAADAALVSEKTTAFDGKSAVRIENKGEDADKSQLIWIQRNLEGKIKQLAKGTAMEVSVMAYAVGNPAQGRIYMESMKAPRCYCTDMALTPGKWQKISQRFAIEDVDYANPYVCIQLLGKGDVIFDCAYLGPAGKNQWTQVKPDNGNYVLNGGAEEPLDDGAWGVINRAKNGAKVFRDGQRAKTGSFSFRIESASKPDDMVAWRYYFPVEFYEMIAPGTEMAVIFDANNQSNPGTKFRCYTEFTRNGKYIGTFQSEDMTVYAGWGQQVFKFKMPLERPTNGYLVLQLMTEG